MTEWQSALLVFLHQHAGGWGRARGVPPFRLRRALDLSDSQFAQTLKTLRDMGLIDYDVIATIPFNDPVNLVGVNVTNVCLTENGWQLAARLVGESQ